MCFILPVLHDVINSILNLQYALEIPLAPFNGRLPGLFREAFQFFCQNIQGRRQDSNRCFYFMGDVVDNLVFGPVHTAYFSICLFYFIRKPCIFNGEGYGPGHHTQSLNICLAKAPFFFINGT